MNAYRVQLVPTQEIAEPEPCNNPAKIATIARAMIGDADREHLLVFYLDTQHVAVGVETVSIGSLNTTRTMPREVFKGAILANALGIVLVHNHPSGNLTFSPQDQEFSANISKAAALLDIGYYDFLVVSRHGYRSARDSECGHDWGLA